MALGCRRTSGFAPGVEEVSRRDISLVEPRPGRSAFGRPIKIGAKVVYHARYRIFQMARSPYPSGCSGRFWSGFDGCERPRRCRNDRDEGRDRPRTPRQWGWSARTGNERPYTGRLGRHHASTAAQYPVTSVRKDLAHVRTRNILVEQVRDDRGPRRSGKSRLRKRMAQHRRRAGKPVRQLANRCC